MIKDEFDRLMSLFHDASSGKKVDLQQLFTQATGFFEHLKNELKNGTEEEKKEVLNMMSEMYKQILKETQQISKASGLTEEQLLSYADNPNNFTPAQWKSIQESKARIEKAGAELVRTVRQSTTQAKEPSSTHPPLERKPHSPHKKSKRSDWTKS